MIRLSYSHVYNIWKIHFGKHYLFKCKFWRNNLESVHVVKSKVFELRNIYRAIHTTTNYLTRLSDIYTTVV